MRLGKAVSLAAILIFAIAISITFFLRSSYEINELAYESACDNISTINTVPPDTAPQNQICYDKNNNKTAYEYFIYYLEKHENSPPL